MKNLIVILFLISNIGFSQKNLDSAKENLSSRSYDSSTSYDSDSSSNDSEGGSFFGDILTDLIVLISYEALLGDFEYRHFAPYPYYYENVNGEYDYGLEKGDKKSLITIRGNYIFSNSVNSFEAKVNYRFNPFVGLDLNHQHFFENSLSGNGYLDVTTFMANYYRIRERSFTGWWGLGFTYVGNEVNTVGFAYNLGLEVYPIKAMSFYVSYKQSFINQSHINVLKLEAKYHIKKVACFTGYHNISLGGVKASGPVLGAQVSF